MAVIELDWTGFDWSKFQELTIAVAESVYPDGKFDEHLGPGQKQEGIDLISFAKKDGSIFTIQCKRVEKMKVSEMDKLVKDFKDKSFSKTAAHFILATTANLQNKNMQDAIRQQRGQLLSTYNITFECWDKKSLATRLKKMWNVVSYYFGKQEADKFCYPDLHDSGLHQIKAVEHYIPRKITLFKNDFPPEDIRWHFSDRKLFELSDLFIADRIKSHHICLVADAYQGKTSYLRQTAFLIKESGLRIHPLIIDVKQFNVQPVESLLNTLYGSWQTIPYKDIVLLVDGLDEVPTDKFIEMIKYINEFSKAYRPVNIIVSCRKLFYNHYDVSGKLENFSTYELCPLNGDNIHTYLTSRLGSLYNKFDAAVAKTGIAAMLYQPFYLVNLTEEFLPPPHKIPATKLKVIESLVDRSFTTTMQRQVKSNHAVKQESLAFKKTIQQFAFALQLAGTNSFKDEDMQQLFSSDERLLLQHNSLVSVTGINWSFNNALFQEHLAASLLVKIPFDDIVRYCTVGITTKKIRTKWIQTISSALSLLDNDDILFQQLLQLIQDDNIELIFQTESSKYTDEFKSAVLKSFMDKCIRLDIRPVIVYEETIGVFIDSSAYCIDYLIQCLSEEKITDRIKIVCCRILKNSSLNSQQQTSFITLLDNEIPDTTNGLFAGHLVDILVTFKLGDKALVDKLVSMAHLSGSLDYRNSVYDLIVVLGMVDKFYEYGIGGIAELEKHNKNISHSGSERSLQNFLLETQTTKNFTLLFRQFQSGDSLIWSKYRGADRKEFCQRLFEKLAGAFHRDPVIIVPIAGFIKSLGKNYLRDEYKEVDEFLEQTNSHSLIVRLLIKDIFVDSDWELGALITDRSYDYVLFEFEHGKDEGHYDDQKLLNCISGLRRKNKNELADAFYQLCLDVTGGKIESTSSKQFLQYLEAEKQKKKNDLIYIQSLPAFKKGLLKYFDAFGKKSIPGDEIHVDWENSITRQRADSHFIYEYLLRWVRSGKKQVTLNECLKQLEPKENFEIFRAEEIQDYPNPDEEAKKILWPILENYYLSLLHVANFKNCMWMETGYFKYRTLEYRLGEIFKKFRFDTPEKYLLEFIWLDNGGTRSFEVAGSNKTESISQLVIDRLNAEGLEKLKQKVLSNMKEGILLDEVFGNHMALCQKLVITDAADIIFEYIHDAPKDNINKMDAVTIFLKLGGQLQKVVGVYENHENYNEYFFYALTELLYKPYPQVVLKKGKDVLTSEGTQEDRKTSIAQLMAESGSMEAFIYLVSLVRLYKKSPHHIQSGHTIAKIETKQALAEMEDVIYLLLDKHFDDPRSFHDSAKSILIEWLYALAGKSETDLLLVTGFLEKQRELLKSQYDNANDLNWYNNKMFEDFRNSEKTGKSIKETKQILSALF